MIVATLLIQVAFIAVSIATLTRFGSWLGSGQVSAKFILALSLLIIWLVMGLTVCCWVWALMFLQLDVLTTLESALYFSIVTFTTLGYGDLILTDSWRILGSLCAVNGLILVGLNTAFLVEALSRIRHSQVNGVRTTAEQGR
ncbi:ion channel [Brumicola blandensis]|uniref:Ion channel n=1 Tax=Brumicola blandensis TaxID=3075611 RepID=A0AAW8R387_9ALTE|nr:ion channel [Alteromonas sp. W409]MDT0583370.1 ion channel [Alteromonas sp. W409]